MHVYSVIIFNSEVPFKKGKVGQKFSLSFYEVTMMFVKLWIHLYSVVQLLVIQWGETWVPQWRLNYMMKLNRLMLMIKTVFILLAKLSANLFSFWYSDALIKFVSFKDMKINVTFKRVLKDAGSINENQCDPLIKY